MRTIGEVLKEARVKRKLTFTKLEETTKIKREFITAIEKEDWEKLPEYPVVNGFVKSLAGVLKIDVKETLAKFRRDYPPKNLRINPKPDVSEKYIWSPKMTFLVAIVVFTLIILSYLGYQYVDFISPPFLEVINPNEEEVITHPLLIVSGLTEPEAVIKVNNQPVIVEEDGKFFAEIEIFEGTQVIEVKAISRSGKETVIHRKIKPELEGTRD
jgi:cytoskeletal protein RodZ